MGATVLQYCTCMCERERKERERKAAKEYRNGNHDRPTLLLVLSLSTSLFPSILSLFSHSSLFSPRGTQHNTTHRSFPSLYFSPSRFFTVTHTLDSCSFIHPSLLFRYNIRSLGCHGTLACKEQDIHIHI